MIYFKDKKNQRSGQLETAAEGSEFSVVANESTPVATAGGTGSKPGFNLIPEASLTAVEFDNNRFEQLKGFVTTKSSSDAGSILLNNPVLLDTIAEDGTVNPQIGVDFTFNAGELGGVNTREQATFLSFQWNRFQWEFDAVRTSAFRYYNTFHWSTKISEFQVFAVSESEESLGDNIQVLFSADGETFTTAALLDSTENDAEYKLGASPQYLRLVFRPTLQLSINDAQVEFEEDQVSFGKEGRLTSGVTIPDARVGRVGAAFPLEITNDMTESADLILDIPADITSSKQLLYFSKLNSQEDIVTPQVGPPGRVDFTADRVLREEKNIAIDARCYGLRNLASGTAQVLITDNLLTNPGFETGDLTGWDLTVTQSGTKDFQIPGVKNIDVLPDEDTTAGFFQAGNYTFGFSIDNGILSQEEDFVPVEFELFSDVIDLAEYVNEIDTNQTFASLSLRYLTYFGGSGPTVRFIGSPTLSGINAAVGTIVSPEYGSNILSSDTLARSVSLSNQSSTSLSNFTVSLRTRIKTETRFLKIQVFVRADSESTSGSISRQKFLSDDYSLTLELPTVTNVKWYKSWRTGQVPTTSGAVFDGWTDSSFLPVTDFIATVGSTHWYQPFESGNTTGSPSGGQALGFSNAFEGDRFKGIQSFRRMQVTDPGILIAQWQGEKDIAGFRIAMHHSTVSNAAFSDAWPRRFQIELLKTTSELGGVTPDINNPLHYKMGDVYRNIDAESRPDDELNGSASNSDGPWSKVTTWLFAEKPVKAEGLRISFVLNCDKFERDIYTSDPHAPVGATDFAAATGCPPDNQISPNDFLSDRGIGVGYFVPLESVGLTSLPVDNVQETHIGDADNPLGTTYVAVDLGRRYDIEINSDLFELIASTPSQSQFNVGTVAYSANEVDDPNQVVWDGGSSNARWIRFVTSATIKFEDPALLESSTQGTSRAFVDSIPQARLNQVRIYPDITKTLIPTVGYNSSWDDLGTTLSDNRTITFVYYSDYPVIALDLGRDYLISNSTTPIRNRHDLVSATPAGGIGSTDTQHWFPNSETDWAYSSIPAYDSERPETISFQAYGAGVPDFPVRWVAVKGGAPLLVNDTGDPPKRYNFQTPGQALFYITIAPRSPEVFTENASWFSNTKTALRDISTFEFTLGLHSDVIDGQDYGSAAGSLGDSSPTTANNIGSPYLAFDGKFDSLGAILDVWGIEVRDLITGLNNPDDAFPHSIWRVFRNTQTDINETKSIKAIKVLGFDEDFYPTSFNFQKLKENSDGSTLDPNLNSSWVGISQASFSNVNTFQDGLGFTHIFPEAVDVKGIRVRIISSVYVDDSIVTQTDPDTGQSNTTFAQVSGPQTRVAKIVMYEEVTEETSITGLIETNHMLSASLGSNTATGGHEISKIKDGKIDTYWQSTGFTDTITISLPAARSITRLEWEKDPNLGEQSSAASTSAPRDFVLKGTVGSIEQTLLVGSGISATTFSGTLSSGPITAKDFTFEITASQGSQEDANSIILSELRLIEQEERITPLTRIDQVSTRRPSGTNAFSTEITYVADTDAVAKVIADGLDGGNDTLWSKRDFFSLWIHINDVSLLDTSFGNFKLGNSSEIFYQWNFSRLSLQSGWNELQLQFTDADDISEIPFQPGFQFDSNTGESKVDFITESATTTSSVDGTFSSRPEQAPGIRFFEVEFRGNKGSQDLKLTLDDFRFVRNRFDDVCKFAPSLYLNNSELFSIFLEGIDIATGTVEFWFQPDWDTGGRLAADRPIIPALFRIVRPDGKFLSLFYRPNQGFVSMVYDGEQLLQFVTSVGLFRFARFETFHVALVWDAESRVPPVGATLALYINGEPVFGTDISWNAIREGGATLSFGGEVGQRFAATPDNSTALLYTAVPTQPAKNTASSWGLIENLKIYNYPKSDFSDIDNVDLTRTQLLTPSELIEISTDGVNFSGVGAAELPLVVQDVSPGESAVVYIRTNIPRGLTGDEQRDASLLVRWKTPLKECD